MSANLQSSVRRRLFNDPPTENGAEATAKDDNELNVRIEDLEEREYLQKEARWNFDFRNEVPLEGDWEWEKMELEPGPEVQLVELEERQQKLQETAEEGNNHTL